MIAQNGYKELFLYLLSWQYKKGKEDEHELVWTPADQQLLQRHLPNIKLVFLNPATRSDDLSDQTSVFGRDLFQVFCSQLVLVDSIELSRSNVFS